MEKKIYIGGKNVTDKCNKSKAYGIKVEDITLETFKRATITREAIKKYKFDASATMEDIEKFVDEKFKEAVFPNDYVRELNKQEVMALVTKYLEADDRKSKPVKIAEFKFGGKILTYKPTFVYLDEAEVLTRKKKEGKIKVPVVEVVTMTTGQQKYTSGRNYGAGKETTSLHHNLEGLGLLMTGKTLLNGKAGIVRVVADALKTSQDTNGDYSREWACATQDNNGTKSKTNRIWYEVFFSEKGKIVPFKRKCVQKKKGKIKHYSVGIYGGIKDRSLMYDNSTLMKGFSETLENFLIGTDYCKSKEACKKSCNFYELCHYNHQPVAIDEKVVEKRIAVEPALNNEQQEVCSFREGICCVDAGPGSGKTQCMAYRIAKLLIEGSKPEDILVMSFSKSAVKVITDRVKFFVHDVYGMYKINTTKIKVATFNSLGNELIQKYYKELGYTEVPSLIDEVEMFNLVKDAIDFNNPVDGFDYKNYKMKSMNRNMRGGVVAEITSQIDTIRQDNLEREAYFEKAEKDGYSEEQMKYIWETNERYSANMIANNLIDYSDQQYQVLRLIDMINPNAIQETYSYAHVIVDEFQDSNDFQMVFIGELINTINFKSLQVVGDDMQAIYGFRGTSPDNIINFEEKLDTFLPVREFTLGRNYRSTEEIVELGNEVISHNSNKVQKVLTSNMGKSGHKPIFKGFEKSTEEIKYICDGIEKLIADGVEKNQIAVICATRVALKSISKELSERGILSQYDMGERLLDNSRVRAAIGFCNFASDCNATKGLLEYLNELHKNKLFEVHSSAEVQAMIDTEKNTFIDTYIPLTMEDKKDYIIKALETLDDKTDSIYTDFVERIKGKSKLNIFELLNYIRNFYELDINAMAEKSGKYDAVALVTAHSSKGKEWEHCFVSLTNFDNVPSRSLAEKEEKRRLIFVAYTRAKLSLTVTTLRNKEKEGEYTTINPWYAEMKEYKSFDNQDNVYSVATVTSA